MSYKPAQKESLIDAATVRAILDYDPITGAFTWRKGSRNKVKAGMPAGYVLKSSGSLHIGIDRVKYAAHRLAWLHFYGEWPKGLIDHINGVRLDNSIANLRAVDDAINVQNQRRPQKRNTTGFLGVTRSQGKYQAQLTANRKSFYIGLFDTPEEAHQAYLAAKRKLHPGCTI